MRKRGRIKQNNNGIKQKKCINEQITIKKRSNHLSLLRKNIEIRRRNLLSAGRRSH